MKVKGTMLALLVLAMLVVGCKSSTRDIELTDGTLKVESPRHFNDIVTYAFSKDGTKMIGMVEGTRGEIVYTIRDSESGATLASYSDADSEWVPLMFTQDGSAVVFARGIEGTAVTAICKIGERLPKHEMGKEGSGSGVLLPNNDWSLWAGSHGQVITDAGRTPKVVGVAEDSEFTCDQFGNAFFRLEDGGWMRVDKQGTERRVPKPSFLVKDPWMRRGSMRLVAKSQEMEHEHAKAYVTAVWLHSDLAKGGFRSRGEPRNLSALIHVGADVLWAAFVPGQDLVLVVDSDGTWLVPYEVRAE